MKESNLLKHDVNISWMTALNAEGKCHIVYMDESYIHKSFAHHDDNNLNDEQYQQVKAAHKGARYCFIGAIIDDDHTIANEKRNEVQKAHIKLEAFNYFQGEKSKQ